MISRHALLLATGLAAFGSGAAALGSMTFYSTTEGTPLSLEDAAEEGRDTEAVKTFVDTGENIYNEDPAVLAQGEELYNGMCSGCHGHYAEGKIGPGLNDDYWTYETNNTDVGLFSTIFGGARGQMGPMYGALTLDEMLLTMAWVRHLYTGPADTATWLTPEQQASFKPFEPPAKKAEKP
ncbi:MAG: cytochrome c(L), periplasmic [Rhodovulum sulfidophilum]|uniref:Cytochrome c-L n=1 Tax=Rhodovulum sulfidophilum TaxID=35806 RepID=A0A2W5N4M3_RHOSU|nr:MAG: cytochrome c(L), periplasmic [Rhodovulum sulfidophilum]